MKSERLFGGGLDSSNKVVNNIHFIVKSAEDEVMVVGMSSGSRIFDLKINFRSFKWELNYIPREVVSFSKEHFVFLERAVLKECLYRNVHFSMVDILFELMRMNLESQKDVQRAGSTLLLV